MCMFGQRFDTECVLFVLFVLFVFYEGKNKGGRQTFSADNELLSVWREEKRREEKDPL